MHFILVCSPALVVDTVRTQNVGYDRDQVIGALSRLDGQGHSHEELDGEGLSGERRAVFRSEVWGAFMPGTPNHRTGRKLPKNSFGTNQYPWQDFGTGIPALLVYDDGQCVDVYPHEEDDRTVTVMEYLTQETP